MKTLLLLRHAKSSWKHPELADHDRPLNKRGKRTTPLMGALLQDEDLIPDLSLYCSAVRAHTTLIYYSEDSKRRWVPEATRSEDQDLANSIFSVLVSKF